MALHAFTIGHSTLPLDQFLALLLPHGITAVCDVRSSPYSRWQPQFNREPFKQWLQDQGIAYVFMGDELGGRYADAALYQDGRVQYERVAATPAFRAGLDRLKKGLERYAVALLCAEADPLACHRTLLVARHLAQEGVAVEHILAGGSAVPHAELERQLLVSTKMLQPAFFETEEDTLARAYAAQARRVAYRLDTPAGSDDGLEGDVQ